MTDGPLDARERVAALLAVAAARRAAGDPRRADLAFADAVAALDDIDDAEARVVTLVRIVRARTEAGDPDGALRTALGAAAPADVMERDDLAAAIAAAHARTGGAAIPYASGPAPESRRSAALVRAARRLAREGRLAEARAVVESVTDHSTRAEGWLAIAGVASADDARRGVSMAAREARSVEQRAQRASLLAAVTRAQLGLGDLPGASVSFERMLRSLYAPRERWDGRWAREVIGELAAAFARAGAAQTADRVLVAIAAGRTRAGDVAAALSAAEHIHRCVERWPVFLAAAGAATERGDQAAARIATDAAIESAILIAGGGHAAAALTEIAHARAAAGDEVGRRAAHARVPRARRRR